MYQEKLKKIIYKLKKNRHRFKKERCYYINKKLITKKELFTKKQLNIRLTKKIVKLQNKKKVI